MLLITRHIPTKFVILGERQFHLDDFMEVVWELIDSSEIRVTHSGYSEFLIEEGYVEEYLRHHQVINLERLKKLHDELMLIKYQ